MLLIEDGMLFRFHAVIARPSPLDTVDTRDRPCALLGDLTDASASVGDCVAGTANPNARPVPSAAVNMPCPELEYASPWPMSDMAEENLRLATELRFGEAMPT